MKLEEKMEIKEKYLLLGFLYGVTAGISIIEIVYNFSDVLHLIGLT